MTSFGNVLCWLCIVVVVEARLTPDAATLGASKSYHRLDILLSIVGEFGNSVEFPRSWKGDDDPCEWFGISCDEDIIKTITFISMNLTRTISPQFTELTSVTVIDLSHNHLTGTIPFELTRLKNLTILDFSYNELHGKVPQPHVRGLIIETKGNPNIETNRVPSPTRNSNKSIVVVLLIGSVVGLVLAGGGAFVFYLIRKMKKSRKFSEPNKTVTHTQQSGDEIVEAESSVIPLQLLKDATEDFCENNKVGEGGFGSVYRSILQNGEVEIAVKRMRQSIGGKGQDEFKSEVCVLTKVRHRNIVALHGYYLEGNERLLVYRYMPQGTLSGHLFHRKDEELKSLECVEV